MSTCLVLLKPREIGILHVSKFLRPFHHKVDEVSTASEAAQDHKVCQNPEEPSQMDVLIFLVLLFIHDGFLQQGKIWVSFKGTQMQLHGTFLIIYILNPSHYKHLKHNISYVYIVSWSVILWGPSLT